MTYGNNKLAIKTGSFYKNRSHKFVLPILIRSYGKSMTLLYNIMCKAAVGVNDKTAANLGVTYYRHLFILVDIKATKVKIIQTQLYKDFASFMKDVRSHEAYEYDYCYEQNMQMVILKLPEKYNEVIENFLKGSYSKMLSEEEIERIFTRDRDIHTKSVLKKDINIKSQFTEEVRKNFFMDDSPEVDWYEFDFPPEHKEEIFNNK